MFLSWGPCAGKHLYKYTHTGGIALWDNIFMIIFGKVGLPYDTMFNEFHMSNVIVMQIWWKSLFHYEQTIYVPLMYLEWDKVSHVGATNNKALMRSLYVLLTLC